MSNRKGKIKSVLSFIVPVALLYGLIVFKFYLFDGRFDLNIFSNKINAIIIVAAIITVFIYNIFKHCVNK